MPGDLQYPKTSRCAAVKMSSLMLIYQIQIQQATLNSFKIRIFFAVSHFDTCGKSFSRAGALKTHINSVHNGQKDHKCDSCGKAFSLAGDLKKHIINTVHNGLKDHKCDSCGKEFSRAGHLKTHVNTVHNGQKEHKCVSSSHLHKKRTFHMSYI